MPLVHPAYCLQQIMHRSSGIYNLLILLELIVRHLVLNLGLVRWINKLRVEHLIVKCIHSMNPLFFYFVLYAEPVTDVVQPLTFVLEEFRTGDRILFPGEELGQCSQRHCLSLVFHVPVINHGGSNIGIIAVLNF